MVQTGYKLMILVALSTEGWTVIIGAIFVGIGSIITNVTMMILEYYREQAKIKRELEIKKALYSATKEQNERFAIQNDKLVEIATDIHKVEIATNSMKDALVIATEKEALARGIVEGKSIVHSELHDRQDKPT